MSNRLSPFDKSLKQVMENYELPYAPSAWKDLEKRLSRSKTGNYAWIVALAAATIFTAGFAFVIYRASFETAEASLANSKSLPFTEFIATQELTVDPKNPENEADIAERESLAVHSFSANAQNQEIAVSAYRSRNSAVNADSNLSASRSQSAVTQENNNANVVSIENKKESSSLSIAASVSSACEGSSVDFQAANGPGEGAYLWNFGDGNFSSAQNPKHVYSKPGVFDISLSITYKDGQIKTKVMEDFVTINPAPNADFEWQYVNDPGLEPTIKLVNTSEFANSFEWTFEDGEKSKVISPIVSYSNKGRHPIVLKVSNDKGCSDSKVAYITIDSDYKLQAREKMQVGKEEFMPEALKQGKINFKLTVYSGAKPIFETSNKAKGWNGTLPNGNMAEAGQQFPWIVIIRNDTTNEEKYYSGIVTIVP